MPASPRAQTEDSPHCEWGTASARQAGAKSDWRLSGAEPNVFLDCHLEDTRGKDMMTSKQTVPLKGLRNGGQRGPKLKVFESSTRPVQRFFVNDCCFTLKGNILGVLRITIFIFPILQPGIPGEKYRW